MGIFLERARGLFQQRRYDLARRELGRELADEPDSANAHALLGLCFNRLKRPDEALASCREAVRLAPGSPYPHYALAYVLDDRNELEEAGAAITEAIRLEPGDAHYHGLLSYIRLRQSRYPEALAAADEGLRLDARSLYCLNRRAMTLANMGRLEEAETVLRTALSLGPENAITLSNLGWVLLQRKQGAAALEYLHEAMRLDPHMDWARQKTIDALVFLVENGQPAVADRYFTEAMRRDPDMAAGRQRLVEALTRTSANLEVLVRAGWFLACLIALATLAWTTWTQFVVGALACDIVFCPSYRLLTDPVFALLLRTRRLGRRLLTPEQARAFSAVAATLAAGLAAVVLVGLVRPASAPMAAVAALSLVLPVAASRLWPPRAARWALPYGLLLLAAGVALVLSSLSAVPEDAIARAAAVLLVLGVVVPSAADRTLRWRAGRKR
jgi:tetratricopeptide (TPR) repeat protein